MEMEDMETINIRNFSRQNTVDEDARRSIGLSLPYQTKAPPAPKAKAQGKAAGKAKAGPPKAGAKAAAKKAAGKAGKAQGGAKAAGKAPAKAAPKPKAKAHQPPPPPPPAENLDPEDDVTASTAGEAKLPHAVEAVTTDRLRDACAFLVRLGSSRRCTQPAEGARDVGRLF